MYAVLPTQWTTVELIYLFLSMRFFKYCNNDMVLIN